MGIPRSIQRYSTTISLYRRNTHQLNNIKYINQLDHWGENTKEMKLVKQGKL